MKVDRTVFSLVLVFAAFAVCLPSSPADAQEGFADILPPSWVIVKLAEDNTGGVPYCRVLPYFKVDEETFMELHVNQGQQLALINLSDEPVMFTFPTAPLRKVIRGSEHEFWVQPSEIRLLRIRNNITVTKKDPELKITIGNDGCLSHLPGPHMFIP